MSTTLMIGLEAAWLTLLGVVEVFAGAWPRGTNRRRRARNVAFTVVNHMLIPPLGLLCAHWLAPLSPGATLTVLPVLVGVPIAIMLFDLVGYWVHRLVHRSIFLWRFHQIHHLDEDFDVSTGTRVHTVESAIHQVVMVTVATVTGIPAGYLAAYGTVSFLMDLFHHTNVAFPARVERWLRRVVVTPALHVTHHRDQIEDTDSNFGFIFSWWDRMFGTYNSRSRTADWRIGLDYSADLGFVRLMIQPFLPTQLKVSEHRRPVPATGAPQRPAPIERLVARVNPAPAAAPRPAHRAAA